MVLTELVPILCFNLVSEQQPGQIYSGLDVMHLTL